MVPKGQGLLESAAIIARPTRLGGKQLPRINARLDQGIALQVRGLAVVVTGDPHVPHEHVRKTSLDLLSYAPEIQRGFSDGCCPVLMGVSRLCVQMSETKWFPAGLLRLFLETQRCSGWNEKYHRGIPRRVAPGEPWRNGKQADRKDTENHGSTPVSGRL